MDTYWGKLILVTPHIVDTYWGELILVTPHIVDTYWDKLILVIMDNRNDLVISFVQL